ncbi:mevalonate kinase family protein [Gaoshiqia sp. Z1-71]|uniref:mevalonate kinase family protein n=1 Tax=Gaoshiqia hydrogeniformans TaxID=3290090 RepID=UPI003BF7D68F
MRAFSAKLLLFGEYGLMFGAKALAVPFAHYQGNLVKPGNAGPDPVSRDSMVELERFVSWIQHEGINEKLNFPLDLNRLRLDIREKLHFRSDVPLQYGVGSSGALCAALVHEYSCYGQLIGREKRKHSLPNLLKQDFAWIESYFHGRSSGLDPLVSFLNQPVLLENGQISLPSLIPGQLPWSVYLIDTGMAGATSPLVRLFLSKMENPDFVALFRQLYLPANDGAVAAFIARDRAKLFACMEEITRFQLAHFPEMIPAGFVELISSLREQNIFVKLLGSGGGGFLQAYVPENVQFPVLQGSIKAF